MPHNFAVLATVRSGSYHLTSLLNSAPDLVCYGEVYKPKDIEVEEVDLARLGLTRRDVEGRKAREGDFVHELSALHPQAGVGFKVFPAHLRENPFLEAALPTDDRRILVLLRPMLEICVSLKAAALTGQFTLRSGEAAVEAPRLVIVEKDLKGAGSIWRAVRRWANKFEAAAPGRVRRVQYAALNNPAKIDRVLDFLGSTAKAGDLASDFRKQSGEPLHERVDNWADMVRWIHELDLGGALGEAGYDPEGQPMKTAKTKGR